MNINYKLLLLGVEWLCLQLKYVFVASIKMFYLFVLKISLQTSLHARSLVCPYAAIPTYIYIHIYIYGVTTITTTSDSHIIVYTLLMRFDGLYIILLLLRLLSFLINTIIAKWNMTIRTHMHTYKLAGNEQFYSYSCRFSSNLNLFKMSIISSIRTYISIYIYTCMCD